MHVPGSVDSIHEEVAGKKHAEGREGGAAEAVDEVGDERAGGDHGRGGPFPATSDGRSTSVGIHAIERFTRPRWPTHSSPRAASIPAFITNDRHFRHFVAHGLVIA